MFFNLVHTLDIRRAKERADVHFDGNASHVLDYNRACTPTASVDQLKLVVGHLSAELEKADSGIIAV